MSDTILYLLVAALVVIFGLNAYALLGDLRSGSNRFAHSHHDVRREQLPLNFWLGVAWKGIGAITALVLAILIALWAM